MDDKALTAATERMAARLRSAQHRLRSDLAQAVSAHDLTRAQLVGVESNARRQSRAGVAATADEFWTHTAQPQAAVLFTTCRHIQDEAGTVVGNMLWRHGREVAALEPGPDDAGRWRDVIVDALQRLGPAFIPPTTIDGLGRWWQNRLRRRATVLAVPGSLLKPAALFLRLVTERELELARRPPWSHGDRLLAAFELAHADLQARAVDLEHDLSRQAATVVDTVLARDSSTSPDDLGFGARRPPARSSRGIGRRAGGPAAGDEPPALIELP